MIKYITYFTIIIFITGCNIDNPFIIKGIKCDSKKAINLVEKILNSQIVTGANMKVDRDNIVSWDYNRVGRHTCKTKVDGSLGQESAIKQMLPLLQYGLARNQNNQLSGWITYTTYITTKDNYYVLIFPKNSEQSK